MAHMQRITAPEKAAKHLKVAAYARISFETERSPKSLSLQVSHYSALIQATPGWEYAGVYADSGISGTTTNRPQFQTMLASARAGEIDLILTKSISRFARNTVDLLEVVRELHSLGVEVRFEKENISTATADGEFMLTLLASFAQAESEQLSANVKWRVRQQFEQGLANGFHMYGYTDSADGTDVQIIEHEAAIIRRAFDTYLAKVSMEQFTKDITDEGVRTREGKAFSPETPRSWLQREAYTGTLTLGRWHTPNLGEHAIINDGEAPMYRVENAIPAIISTEVFAKVQVERKRRRDAGAHANWSIPTSCFTSKLTCGICGRNYARSGKRSTTDKINYMWICRTRRDGVKRTGGRTCTNKSIPEDTLKEVCSEVLGIDEFSPDVFEQQVERIIMPAPDRITFHLRDGQIIDREWQSQQRLKAWPAERRKAWSEYQKAQWAKKRVIATATGEVA
ncbi:recombinase family protein [Trueperella pyogenes]|uniref:recombinase family protein n=1 Tax=Trueperella pyogenes TaxID=1661 RepID=UPI00345D0339